MENWVITLQEARSNRTLCKSETRNTKSETNPEFKCQKLQTAAADRRDYSLSAHEVSDIWISIFEFVSDLVFRASDFVLIA